MHGCGFWGGCYSHPPFVPPPPLSAFGSRGVLRILLSHLRAWNLEEHKPHGATPEVSFWGFSCSILFRADLLLSPLEAAGTILRIKPPGCTKYSRHGFYTFGFGKQGSSLGMGLDYPEPLRGGEIPAGRSTRALQVLLAQVRDAPDPPGTSLGTPTSPWQLCRVPSCLQDPSRCVTGHTWQGLKDNINKVGIAVPRLGGSRGIATAETLKCSHTNGAFKYF